MTIAGAGLAGLSAAVALADAGVPVELAEAAAQAGGRCRSYHDPQLDAVIDNGNHLILSGNRAVADYLARIGASDRLAGPEHADFAFYELPTRLRWTLAPNDGPVPWWLLSRQRRTPGTSALAHLPLAALARAARGETVGQRIATTGPLWTRLAEPVLLAALNTAPAEGSAYLAGRVLAETLLKGGRASRPLVATPSLGAAFVDPALVFLARHGTMPSYGRRLRQILFEADRVVALDHGAGPEPLGEDAALILAVPAWSAAELVPGLTVPDRHAAIVNAHFLMPAPSGAPPITAIVGGLAEWVFAFADRISVTISAADRLVGSDRTELAARIWADVAAALGLGSAPVPPYRVLIEKRATFAATPEQDRLRPPAATRWRNLFLAGDWTQTCLPATIEGALRSGATAANLALRRSAG
ncbi:MAG: hydroxysqualene dehydroxylase HpnE [Novosphingobium sp.]